MLVRLVLRRERRVVVALVNRPWSSDVGGRVAVENDAAPPDALASLLLLVREALNGEEPALVISAALEQDCCDATYHFSTSRKRPKSCAMRIATTKDRSASRKPSDPGRDEPIPVKSQLADIPPVPISRYAINSNACTLTSFEDP